MKLGLRIFLMIAGLVAVSMLVISASVYVLQRGNLHHLIEHGLGKERDAALAGFESYLESIDHELQLWAKLPSTVNALESFETAWNSLGSDRKGYLQKQYITDNPNPLGEKDNLSFASDGSSYSRVHKTYHPFFKALKDSRGFYDVFLIDAQGNVVYSVYKELDYATNLVTGEFSASGLGDVFRAARDRTDGDSSFDDFSGYEPSLGAPASFIARKIVSESGEFLGVLAFQMPIDRLDALVGDLGEGRYALVVGADGLLRNNDARFGGDAILKQEIGSSGIAEALAGVPAIANETRDGVSFLQSVDALEFLGTKWAFIVEVDRKVAFAPLTELRNMVVVVALACLGLAAISARWLGGSIAGPIASLAVTLRTLIDGNRDAEVAYQDRTDEIGDVATSVGYFKDKLAEMDALQSQQAEAAERERKIEREAQEAAEAARETERRNEQAEQARQEARREKEERIAREISEVVEYCARGEFSKRLELEGKEGVFVQLSNGVNRIGEVTEVGLQQISLAMASLAKGDLTFRLDPALEGTFEAIANDVHLSMDSLATVINTIRESSGNSSHLMKEVAESAQNLSKRTEANAAALEQTSAALTQMEQSARGALDSAQSAKAEVADVVAGAEEGIEKVKQTMSAMTMIQQSSSDISKIVELIDGIAFQTNLLALNAGVEAARAGDAGRGFSVVANEVRELATRSAEAAREISALITESGARVEKGVEYTETSMKVLEAIGTSVNQISKRIEELATSSAEQSNGIAQVTTAVQELDGSTQENAAMFEESTAISRQMEAEIDLLVQTVGAFVTADASHRKDGHDAATGAFHAA